MKLNLRQYPGTIQRELRGVYWLSSDEPLLLQEAADLLRIEAKNQGFLDRERYVVEANFDWSEITNSADSLSLFSDKKLIDIQFKCKPNDKAKSALKRLTQLDSNDMLVIVCSDKVDSKTSNTKWFKEIESQSNWLPIWPLKSNELKPWIHNRLANYQLTASDDAVALIAQRTEGNLLATAQEIEKLQLIVSGNELSLSDVESTVAVNSRYNVFDLGDTLLMAKSCNAIRAIHGLRGEGTEPSIVLWAIAKDVRLLIGVKKLVMKNQDSDKALMSLGVFKTRQSMIRKAAQRLTPGRLKRSLELCNHADTYIKSSQTDLAWHTLEQAALIILGAHAPHLSPAR